MKIAHFFENDIFCGIDDKIENKHLKVLVVDINIENETDSKAETITEHIVRQNINYLSLWLLSSQIDRIVVTSITDTIRKLFEKMNISIQIVDEHYFASSLLDSYKINRRKANVMNNETNRYG